MNRARQALTCIFLMWGCVACSPRIESIAMPVALTVDVLSTVSELDLPESVIVTYSDGSTAPAGVVWNTLELPNPLRTDAEITGKVKGTNLPARLRLSVSPDSDDYCWFDPANPGEMTEKSGVADEIAAIVGTYFRLRQNSVVSTKDEAALAERDELKAQLSGQVAERVLEAEDVRQQGHDRAACSSRLVVVKAYSALQVHSVTMDPHATRLRVYELTRCDYRDEAALDAGSTDTFKFALWHNLLFSRVDGHWVLVQDEYEEPDIFTSA